MGAVALLVLLSVPLAGGQLQRLGTLHLRSLWLLPLALGLQVLVINVIPDAPTAFLVPVHLATYVLGAVFVWHNRHLTGLPVLALGGALNGITIAANGGTLPASLSALRRAGLTPEPGAFTNSGVLPDPHLAFLGDVFAVPSRVPLANVFSVGDVLILVGAAVLVHKACRPRTARGRAARQELRAMTVGQLQVELHLAERAAREAERRGQRLEQEVKDLRRNRVTRPRVPRKVPVSATRSTARP